MYQDQTTIDNDLQKAIDNITNSTNVDPAFSDPVATPTPMPIGTPATYQPNQDINNYQEPPLQFNTINEAQTFDASSQPVAPVSEISNTVGTPSTLEEPQAPLEPSAPEPVVSTPEPSIPTPEPTIPEPTTTPIASEPPQTTTSTTTTQSLNVQQIKEAALRDIIPLLDVLNMSPSQKFNICRDIFEDLHDDSVLEQAYHAASDIPDDSERAEALLYLVESIDKM